MKTDCPSDQALRRYAIGDVDDALGEGIERHLAACPACEDSVARFDSTEDTLMRHLPLAAAQESELPADPPGWLDRLRTGPPAAGAANFELPAMNDAAGPLAESSAYELLRVLGRGGMGVVYRARHRQLNRNVALKVLSPRLMATPEARRRFEREIQILGGLKHPGIVMATDAGRMGEAAYLVMELIDGVDLARIVRQGGPLTVAEACEAARQMATALAVAHQAGTVHRDVKPSNAMVDRQGQVKLLDFGLAHLAVLSNESSETSLGRLLGTLDYMAPEQADRDQPLDARADLFGLGATLFYLLTGRPPHGAPARRSLLDQLRSLAAAEAPRVSSLRADIPPELDDFIGCLLSRDPDERPRSAEIVAGELSTWAGGDLAGRVEEVSARQDAEDLSSDDSEAARRSLSELLGVGAAAISPDSGVSQAKFPGSGAKRRWTGRNWAWLAAAAAAIGVIVFSVTILLRTHDGTLRIESEVDDVRIELVDERNQTRELQVDRGESDTTLRAGRYRVRFAGRHDGIAIDRNVITLQRGEETVARITRSAEGLANADADTTAGAAERLYQGKPESEWQRLFAAETAPVAKLEAAQALLVIASELPAAEQIERILEVGEEIVRASAGEDSLEFVFESGVHPTLRARRWSLDEAGKVYDAYRRFLSESNVSVRKLAAETLAKSLCQTVLEGEDPRAAFAAWLLRYAAMSRIESDPAAAQIVLRELDVPLTGLDRSAIYLLVRSRYVGQPSAEQRRSIFLQLSELAGRLRDAPAEGFNNSLKDELLGMPGQVDWPVNLRQSLAGLILDDIVEPRSGGVRHVAFDRGMPVAPYDQRQIAASRSTMKPLLDVWLSVANEYLEQHRNAPYDAGTHEVVRTLELVLLVYSDADEWPVEKTASLLTEQLGAYYTDDPQATTEASIDDLLPAPPARLLTQIVRVTGELPDFVRAGHPKAESVARRLQRFESLLSGEVDVRQAPLEFDSLRGLLDEAPYEVIKLSVGQHKLPPGTQIIHRGERVPLNPTELLYATSSLRASPAPPTDPLLLLAVLADLTGESEAEDERIATLLANTAPKVMLRGHLENLLASPLKAREHARRLLGKMAQNARSQDLIDAIAYLDPSLVDLDSTPPSTGSDAGCP